MATTKIQQGSVDCKVRPILFSGEMVRALLESHKTQTRREVKPQPVANDSWMGGYRWQATKMCALSLNRMHRECPYGKCGDLLWVREKFMGWYNTDDGSFSHVAAFATDDYELEPGERWAPSIHMPRRASRLTLRLTDVRVERLQDISEADAVAEGCTAIQAAPEYRDACGELVLPSARSARDVYSVLWESINGPGSWETNPFAWCLSFSVIRKNVDDVLKEVASAQAA